MRLRHKVKLRAFRDVEVGSYDSKREFSEPVTCYANIEAVASQRFIGSANSNELDRATSHTAVMRVMDLEIFTVLEYGGYNYRIISTQSSPGDKFMNVALALTTKCEGLGTETVYSENG